MVAMRWFKVMGGRGWGGAGGMLPQEKFEN